MGMCFTNAGIFSCLFEKQLKLIFAFDEPSNVGLLLAADLTRRTSYDSDLLHFDSRSECRLPIHPVRTQRKDSQNSSSKVKASETENS